MGIHKLYKIELYRFLHSKIFLIGTILSASGLLVFASQNGEVLMSDGTVAGDVAATMKIANLMLTLLAAVVIGCYVGREYKLKTINYEVMGGYPFWRICLAKTFSCGLLIPVILLLCILMFFVAKQGGIGEYSVLKLLFLFIILCHICACSTLYVMLVRDGALGGCLAFIRFTMFEVLIISAMMLGVSDSVLERCKYFVTMSQWSVVTSTKAELSWQYMISIILAAIAEYLLLLFLVQKQAGIKDF